MTPIFCFFFYITSRAPDMCKKCSLSVKSTVFAECLAFYMVMSIRYSASWREFHLSRSSYSYFFPIKYEGQKGVIILNSRWLTLGKYNTYESKDCEKYTLSICTYSNIQKVFI